jgi:hypothetical protein
MIGNRFENDRTRSKMSLSLSIKSSSTGMRFLDD